jgi:hypothetical protein
MRYLERFTDSFEIRVPVSMAFTYCVQSCQTQNINVTYSDRPRLRPRKTSAPYSEDYTNISFALKQMFTCFRAVEKGSSISFKNCSKSNVKKVTN